MTDILRTRLADLKRQFGDYQLTDEDYYESDDVAEFSMDAMFGYFRDELEQGEAQQLLECARKSKLFLHDLIGVGETMVAEFEDTSDTPPLTWEDLSGLASRDAAARQVILARSDGLKLDLAPMQVLAAESSGLDVTYELPFGATANVYEDNSQLVIKVSTEATSLDGQLVGYCISGAEQDLIGFILLRAGVLGTVSGMTRLDRSAMSGKQNVEFRLIENSDLCSADFPLLDGALANDLEDQRSVDAWRRWIAAAEASDDGPGLAKPLERLKSRLP